MARSGVFPFGLIYFVPFLGAAAGAALFVLTSGAPDREKAIAELKHYDFEIIWTNLPEEQLQQLREVFAG